MSTIDEIKARVDIVELVSETVQLRRSGKNYTGFCPFHSNTRTPAFVVFPETGTWRCFGQCNEGSDIFGYVMKRENLDFSEALRFLAERAGVELKPPTPEEQVKAGEYESLRAILEEAVGLFRHNLRHTPAGEGVLNYLLDKRGLTAETIEAFGLGYALDSWEALLTHFRPKGVSEADLLACGLISERESGEGETAGYFDRFRHRLMIPIRDERGRMSGFGARIVDPEAVPKFLNSPQTVLFDKGRLLFGLDRARKGVRAQDQAVIVEGYFDVIALHQAGFTNVVSPMGTALTESQLRLLKRFSQRIVLALDADVAGDKATLRGLEVARRSLDRQTDPVFNARGLLGYEARLQAEIRVTTLPPGIDPDEVIAQDPKQWEEIVSNARPIIIHIIETLIRDKDADDPKVKAQIANEVLPLIEDVPDSFEREDYRQRLARMLRVDERALQEWSPRQAGRRKRPGSAQRSEGLSQPPKDELAGDSLTFAAADPVEAYCLSVLLRRPDLVYRVDRTLQENGLSRLMRDDFQSADHQALLQLIEDSLIQDHAEPLLYVLNSLSLPLMELADQLLLKSEKLDPNEARVLEDLIRSILILRQRRLRQQMDHMRYLMEEAQHSGDVRASDYHQTMARYIATKLRLDRAMGETLSHSDPRTDPSAPPVFRKSDQ
jgi:DNA primase